MSTWYGWLLDPALPRYFLPSVALTLESKSSDAPATEASPMPLSCLEKSRKSRLLPKASGLGGYFVHVVWTNCLYRRTLRSDEVSFFRRFLFFERFKKTEGGGSQPSALRMK